MSLVTLGCARNEVDSEELAGRLEADGWELVEDGAPTDVAVINTCGFVESAKKDSIDVLLAAADTGTKVVAVGCLAERYGAQLAEQLPEAAAVLGFDSYADLSTHLQSVLDGTPVPSHTPGDRRRLLPISPVARQEPEALVDVHNNTGHNPVYGVAPRVGDAERQLVGLFAGRVVHYDLRLGALVEETPELCPTVVVEAGRAGAPGADAAARRGLDLLLGQDDIVGSGLPVPVLELFSRPVRVEAAPGVSLAYGAGACAGAALTVAEDIDRHNFERLAPGTAMGWLAAGAPWPLVARGADGADCSRELFELVDGRLVTRRELVPIMMTTDPGIATSDCLFYAVEPS